MGKFLSILIVLFTSASLLQAQEQQYVRISEERKAVNDKSMRFFKGEIYVLKRQNDKLKYFDVNGVEYYASYYVDLISGNGISHYNDDKNRFVKRIKGKDSIRVDISSVSRDKDTVWLANYTDIVKRIVDTITLIHYNDVDTIFRLIIPDAVTVWYNKKDLTEYEQPVITIPSDEIKIEKNKSNRYWLLYAIGGCLILFIASVIWRFISEKSKQKNDNLKGKHINVPPEAGKIEEEKRVASSLTPCLDISSQLKEMQKTIQDLHNINSILPKYEELLSYWEPLQSKLALADCLKDSAGSMYDYLVLCQKVEKTASSHFDKLNSNDTNQSLLIACLLQKFRNSISDVSVEYWLQTLREIKDLGITADEQVIKILSKSTSESNKQKEFWNTLFNEILFRYSSSVLILAESFRNLGRFEKSVIFAGETKRVFEEHIADIENKAKTFDMEVKYVPLFEKFDKYAAKVESINKSKSFPYSEVQNLQRDDIAEIVEYGVKTEFKDIKTQIIIE
jgi:hypothetical protein